MSLREELDAMHTYDDEAVYQDADIQMAEMNVTGNRFHHWQRRGVSANTVARPAILPTRVTRSKSD